MLYEGQLALVRVRGRGETVVRITKRNPKNFKAQLEDGTFVNGPHSAFRLAPADTVFNDAPAEVRSVGMPTYLDPGTVVRAVSGTWLSLRPDGDRLFVVVACDRHGKHRLFPLGGSKRYYRGLEGSELEVVPVEAINRA